VVTDIFQTPCKLEGKKIGLLEFWAGNERNGFVGILVFGISTDPKNFKETPYKKLSQEGAR